MKATGIVRRIDELGRVVIPKEIRKTLRLKEGEEIEIFTESGELIFRKYSALEGIDGLLRELAHSFSHKGERLIITDTEKVIADSVSKCEGLRLNDSYLSTVSRRMNVDVKKELSFINEHDLQKNKEAAVSVITAGGDLYGSVIILSEKQIEAWQMELTSFIANFVKSQLYSG